MIKFRRLPFCVSCSATGFTTRSDIGPDRDANNVPDDCHPVPAKQKKEHKDLEEDVNDVEYAGYGGFLFNKYPYDKDDEEGDVVCDPMDEKRRVLRKKKGGRN